MKSFSTYVAEATDEHTKLIDKLEKTRMSIYSHLRRGGASFHQKGGELAYRYTALRDKLRETPEGEARWRKHCEKLNFHPAHDGYDCYA